MDSRGGEGLSACGTLKTRAAAPKERFAWQALIGLD